MNYYGYATMSGATIGITYDNDVANWDVPGTEWYVPKPAEISCDAVNSYIALLTDYIRQWQERLSDAQHTLIRNRTKIANAQFMVNALNQRLGEYQVRLDICLNPPPPPPVETPVVEEPGGNTQSGSSGWLLGGAALLIGVLILRRRNKNQRRKTNASK